MYMYMRMRMCLCLCLLESCVSPAGQIQVLFWPLQPACARRVQHQVQSIILLGFSCHLLAQSRFARRIAQRLCPTLPSIVVPLPGTGGWTKKLVHRLRAMGTVASRRTRGTHTNSMYSVFTVDHPQSPDRP